MISLLRVAFHKLRLHGLLKRLNQMVLLPHYKLLDTQEAPVYRKELTNINLSDFTFRDEEWSQVVNLQDILFAKMFNRNIKVIDNDCLNTKIKSGTTWARVSGGRKRDNWVYWMSGQDFPREYEASFDTEIESFLTEFQIAFRHQSVADRIRFQVVDNKWLSFDAVKRGFFFNYIHKIPFEFELGRKYNIRLTVLSDTYSFAVDGKTLMTITDSTGQNANGGIVLVLWDKEGKSDMKVNISNFKVYKIDGISKG